MEQRQLPYFELRELYYFVAVAEELHFARAADRVGIHQSPLSKAISLMERHLGVRLFVRDRRSTQLTRIGEMLLNDARRILAEADQARLRILAAAAGRTGRLRIAIAGGAAHPRLAMLLRETDKRDSGIDLQVARRQPSEQLQLLRSGLLDIGLAGTAPDFRALVADYVPNWTLSSLGEDLQAVPIWKDTLSVVIERTHPLADRKDIDWDALATMRLIVVEERSKTCVGSSRLIDLCGRLRQVEYVASVELLLTLAAAGKGVGLIGETVARTIQRADLAFRPLSTRRAKITTFLLRRKDDDSPLIERFIERAQRAARDA